MCKEMSVILVNKVVDPKRIIGKNGGLRRRRGTRGRWPQKNYKHYLNHSFQSIFTPLYRT
jgi:hypothetical protein